MWACAGVCGRVRACEGVCGRVRACEGWYEEPRKGDPIMSSVVAVPAPDSPETTQTCDRPDWFTPVKAASAIANTWGGTADRNTPR